MYFYQTKKTKTILVQVHSNKTRKKNGKNYEGEKEKKIKKKKSCLSSYNSIKNFKKKSDNQIRMSTTLLVLCHHFKNCRDILVLAIAIENSVDSRRCHVSSIDVQGYAIP